MTYAARVLALACITCGFGCGDSRVLSRKQAAETIGAELEARYAVSKIQVYGRGVDQLVESGHLSIQWINANCGNYEPCGQIQVGPAGQEFFTGASGTLYNRNSRVDLDLRNTLHPSHIEVTGIVGAEDDFARVDFAFGYDVPGILSALRDLTHQTETSGVAQYYVANVTSIPAELRILDPLRAQANFRRYDDGWRLEGRFSWQ